MHDALQYRPARSKGFTLIELLVVIVIIGILAGLAATNFGAAQRNARDNARKSQLNSIANAVESYYGTNHAFPGTLYSSNSVGTSGCGANAGASTGGNFVYYSAGKDCTADSQFVPYPTWIPGLAAFINPMPTETRYLGKDGTSGGAYYDILNKNSDVGLNKTRTYAYYHLTGGYLLVSKLEGASTDTADFSASPINNAGDPPYLPGANPTNDLLYVIRK